jgi:anti-sigma B factor antagonist
MNHTISRQTEWHVLKIEGELDANTANDLRPVIAELVAQKPAKVRVDLEALRLIDSSGVGAIVSLFKRVKESGGDLQIIGLRGQPQAIFRVLRLDRALPVVE